MPLCYWPFKPTGATFLVELCHTITRHPIQPESCPNPPQMRKSYSSDFEKLGKVWILRFCRWRYNWGRFTNFWPRSRGHWRQPNEPFLAQAFFWKLDYDPSLYEPLIGFLAFLVPKLWLKNHCLGKKSSPTNVTLAILARGRNSPSDWARELFTPSKTRKVF